MSPPKSVNGERATAEVIDLAPRQLLRRHLAGDEAAFPELIQMFRSKVFTQIVRMGVPESDRDDLFQEIFLTVHRNASRYDPTRALNPWLFTIVVNTVRSFFRKRSALKQGEGTLDIDESIEAASEAPTSSEVREAKETASWLEEQIKELPISQREALTLSCLHGFEHAEIGAAMKIPVNTVKTNLRRARQTLISKLGKRLTQLKREVV